MKHRKPKKPRKETENDLSTRPLNPRGINERLLVQLIYSYVHFTIFSTTHKPRSDEEPMFETSAPLPLHGGNFGHINFFDMDFFFCYICYFCVSRENIDLNI